MRERPILFSGPMVRAILEGRKTQTRRVVAMQEDLSDPDEPCLYIHRPNCQGYCDYDCTKAPRDGSSWNNLAICPYGQPGDRLWVRETWAYDLNVDREKELQDWVKAEALKGNNRLNYRADPHTMQTGCGGAAGRWRPSIHMPRWASRITLEVTEVRVQRLQNIFERDAEAEGFLQVPVPGRGIGWGLPSGSGPSAFAWSSLVPAPPPPPRNPLSGRWESNPRLKLGKLSARGPCRPSARARRWTTWASCWATRKPRRRGGTPT